MRPGMALCLVDLAAQLNQHRPVLVAFRYRVLIRLALFCWLQAFWLPIRLAWERAARLQLAVLQPESVTI
ncbi:hypothetical protein D3C71_1800640 [compost metagenome]